jgi:hypothetical protein
MNTFFSLIQYCPDVARGDVFTIGIILRADAHEYYRCAISESRIRCICRAFAIKETLLLRSAINGIKHQRFDVAYLQYLHAYENGIIRYTAPKPVATNTPEETFKQLYQVYVAESIELQQPHTVQRIGTVFHNALKKDTVLQTRLSFHYSLERVLQEYMPNAATMDFIGGNGSVFCGQMPNLRAATTLPRLLLVYESLKQRFEAQKLFDAENYHVLINMKFFGGQEFKEHRNALQRWQQSKGFTMLEIDNIGDAVQVIRSKAEEKDVQPFETWLAAYSSPLTNS